MAKETKKSNFIEVAPVIPTYSIDEIDVDRVVKFLLDPKEGTCYKVVLQSSFGACVIEDAKHLTISSTLPKHEDTVRDYIVNQVFENSVFDEEFTIEQFRFWGIEKVYLAGHCDRVLDIEEFLNRVKVHFVDKDKDYSVASFEDKARIFMN